jgi:hypothetical protein
LPENNRETRTEQVGLWTEKKEGKERKGKRRGPHIFGNQKSGEGLEMSWDDSLRLQVHQLKKELPGEVCTRDGPQDTDTTDSLLIHQRLPFCVVVGAERVDEGSRLLRITRHWVFAIHDILVQLTELAPTDVAKPLRMIVCLLKTP